jgi:hypothetical protein
MTGQAAGTGSPAAGAPAKRQRGQGDVARHGGAKGSSSRQTTGPMRYGPAVMPRP